MTPLPARAEADRCPGALTLHEAADGLLARVRLPGGFVDARVLSGLGEMATRFGDGRLELTSRGNVQLRSIAATQTEALADELAALGLLPSLTHERVRNIVASPLAGLNGADVGRAESGLEPYVAALDQTICATAELAELSGRFLFGFDDGSGDIAQLTPDVTAHRDDGGWLLSPGGFRVSAADGDDAGAVAAAMVTLAIAFLQVRAELDSTAWRIADLNVDGDVNGVVDGRQRVAERAAGLGLFVAGRTPLQPAPPQPAPPTSPPAGVIAQRTGGSAVVVVAPLGRLTSAQATRLAELIGQRPARITPWRSVVIVDVDEPDRVVQLIRADGLDVGAESIWNNLSACAGRPGCAKSYADVQADAARAVAGGQRVPATASGLADIGGAHRPSGLPVHWSGCSRRCGHPNTQYVDVLAGPDGYHVDDSAAAAPNDPDHQ
ncbi:precorrin-3B synthase [Frankineae bacterium MT45]|nr:precorrin-3B synthase [Frankineae bacterium MT45]